MAHAHRHSHSQGHEHGGTAFDERGRGARVRLWWALIAHVVLLVVEFVGGLVTGSLALLSDAGHMLTDVAALALALVAAHLAAHPPTPSRTFGLLRAEVVGAFLNGLTLVGIVIFIFWEAWERFGQPVDINAPAMLLIATLGLLANLAAAAVLFRGRAENINVRGAFLHVIADALGSVGAMTAGVVIWVTGWGAIDLITSLFIGVLILIGSLGLLRETMGLLLNATPVGIDYDEVKTALEAMDHVDGVLDLHIWSIVPGMDVLTAHVRLQEGCSDSTHWQECLREAGRILRERFGIEHATLQIEPPDFPHPVRLV